MFGVFVHLLFARPSLQVLRAGTMVERFAARMQIDSGTVLLYCKTALRIMKYDASAQLAAHGMAEKKYGNARIQYV